MKIQIAAVLSTDCYLLSPAKGINSRWAFPKQHTLFSLRNETDLLLSKDTSLLSLLSEKQHNTDITYLAEVTPDTLDLIKGLLLYGLADELYRLLWKQKAWTSVAWEAFKSLIGNIGLYPWRQDLGGKAQSPKP